MPIPAQARGDGYHALPQDSGQLFQQSVDSEDSYQVIPQESASALQQPEDSIGT